MKRRPVRSVYPLYEDTSQYDLWLKLLLGGILVSTLIPGIVLLPTDILGAQTLFGVTAFDALLFHAILPRRFQIFEDRVKIILGYPFSFDIPFSTIKEAEPASGSKAFIYRGIRFATSAKSLVETIRRHGLSIVISPRNRESFSENLNQALQSFEDYHLDNTSLQKS